MKEERKAAFLDVAAVATRSADGMKTVFDICKGLQKAMQPFADLQSQIRVVQATRLAVGRPESAVRRIIESQGRFARAVARLHLGSLATAARELAGHAHKAQALDEAGWLPHQSMPFDRVEECAGDADAIHRLLSQHYREQWSAVHAESRRRWWSTTLIMRRRRPLERR